MADEDLRPISEDKPFTHFIVTKSQIQAPYHLVLPVKMRRLLPVCKVQTVLNFRNKQWKMYYHGDAPADRAYFGLPGWKSFAIDNKLKLGDGCVFELTECSTKLIEFRVQILNGDLPAELLARSESGNLEVVIEIE